MAWDVVVCGLGAMGSAALHTLARRGQRVLGLERYSPGHHRGSSHGRTRVIRLGYFEHPSYVPLLRRAYALWRELEAAAGRQLLHVTGIAEIGRPDSTLVRGTLLAARIHGLRHEVIGAFEAMRRLPALRLPPDYVVVLQPDGGFLDLEVAMAAQLAMATVAGADVHENETVRAVEPIPGGVRIMTDLGRYEAGAAIVTAGPWISGLLPDLHRHLRVTRQAAAWFEPANPGLLARCPVLMIEGPHGLHYGIPPHDGAGIKIAKHHHADEAVDPDTCERRFSAADEALIRAAVIDHLPAANGRLLAGTICLYTMTPDGDFLIDRLPSAPTIVVASPCSGHGFKFAPIIGEILADLAMTGMTTHDIGRFSLERLG